MSVVSVVGASGYIGGELVRILLNHPKIDKIIPISQTRVGKHVSKIHPNLYKIFDEKFLELNTNNLDSDLVFFATPPGEWINDIAPELIDSGIKVISLGGKFRISDPKIDSKWYPGYDNPKLSEERVYGLPELFRDKIKSARFIANPGCYPTSVLLGFLPLFGIIDMGLANIAVNSYSGTSGGGSGAFDHSEVAGNIIPYAISNNHRHRPEIEFILNEVLGRDAVISFTPSVVDMKRGIESYMLVFPGRTGDVGDMDILAHYQKYYADEPFVRIREEVPKVCDVNMTNFCDITVTFDKHSNRVLIISAIDNLIKGGSGQAVQNMNIMLGFDEMSGLHMVSGHP